MPRQAKPRFNKAAGLWYANIGPPTPDGRASEVYFSRPVGSPPVRPPKGPGDEAGAWDWFRAYQAGPAAPVFDPGDPTTMQLVEGYLQWAEGRVAANEMDPGHYKNRAIHLGHFCRFVPPGGSVTLGALRAGQVGHDHLDAAVREWTRTYSQTYVRHLVASVLTVFNWANRPGADRRRLLKENPLAGYARPALHHAPERFAERAEAAAFLRAFRRFADRLGPKTRRADRLAILMERVLIRTGARPGELCRLRWEDLRWEAGATPAGHTYARAVLPAMRGGRTGWKSGKSTGRARTIYLTPALTRALRRERTRVDRHPEHVFWRRGGRGTGGEAVPWTGGAAFSKVVLRARRAAIAEQTAIRVRIEAGDPEVKSWERRAVAIPLLDEGENRVTNYRWRHTAASSLLMMGIDVATVAELLGTSVEMVRRHYGHLLSDHLADAAQRLGTGRPRRPSA